MASQPATPATNTPSPDTPAIEAAMQVINLKLSDAQEKAVKEAMQAMLDAQEKKTATAMRALRVAQDKRDAEKKQESAGIHTQLAYISAQLQDISKSNASNVKERTVFAQVQDAYAAKIAETQARMVSVIEDLQSWVVEQVAFRSFSEIRCGLSTVSVCRIPRPWRGFKREL